MTVHPTAPHTAPGPASAGAGRRGRPAKSGAAPLDRERVVRAAVGMTSTAEGEPLTFRALGARLGVDPSALYRYVASKDELLLAVADGIIGEAMSGFAETGDWRADLTELLRRVHRAYLDHPQVAVAATPRVTRLPAEMDLTETLLRILIRAGLDEPRAVLVYRALEDTVLAWTGFRAAVDLHPEAEADQRKWEQTYRAADPHTHPFSAAHAGPMTAVELEEAFATALQLQLAGLATELESAP